MKFIKEYKLTILVFIGIMILILMPGNDVPSVGIPNIDKVVHFSMFAAITSSFSFEYYSVHKGLPAFLTTCLLFIILGALTEILQYFVPGRSCDILDLLADSIGIITASLIFSKIKCFQK